MTSTGPRLVKRRNGRLYWIAEDGYFVPYIAGGGTDDPPADPEGDDEDEDDDDDEDDDPDAGSGKFTQEQVNRFLAKERKKSRRAVEKEVVEKLGMPVTDAVDTLKKLADGQKPEAMQAVERRSRELDTREAQLDTKEQQLLIREKLQEAGVLPARLKRAVKLVELDDDEPDDDDILAAIDELKADMPELFVSAKPKDDDDDEEPPAPKRRKTTSSEPARPPRRRQPPEDAFNIGAEKAKQFSGTSFL